MGESERYSDSWSTVDIASLPDTVREAIAEIDSATGPVRVLHWNVGVVAVAIDLRVDIPTRGTVGGVDIRRSEPVLIVIDTRDYPNEAPGARSDRRSFPTDRLPHLNPVSAGQPPSLCLHRGNIDDWFAEHSVRELVERIRSWYRDAARDRLMRGGDVFEPTRLPATGYTMLFASRAIERAVVRRWGQTREPGHAFAFASIAGDAVKQTGWDASVAISLRPFLADVPDAELVDLARAFNEFSADDKNVQRSTLAICAWTAFTPVDTYFGRLPTTYGELSALADQLGIPLRAAVAELAAQGAQLLHGIPVALGILRPRPLQGRASLIEWLCFVIISPESLRDEDKVLSFGHREPLTPEFARTLSEASPIAALARPLVVGCGALGSKLSLHLAKAGFVAQRLVDYASLGPHHLVRHALLGEHLGKTKAEGVCDAILGLFPGQRDLGTEVVPRTLSDALADRSKLEDRSIVIDATASASVREQWITADLPADLRVCRVELASRGELGLLAFEGRGRNPRVDDLQLYLFDLARTNPVVSSWLRGHSKDKPDFEDIGIGLGCSSATFRMPDDLVSFHAAALTRALHRVADQERGHLVITSDSDREPATKIITVPPVTILSVSERPGWSVRIAASAMTSMRSGLVANGRRETGGLLVGYAHVKRKIVYVAAALAPSPDSQGSRYKFVRGVEGYPAAIEDIEIATGGILGYIGEWHTHPEGSTSPSSTDLTALETIRRRLAPAEVPGMLLIAGPRSITVVMSAAEIPRADGSKT